MKIVKYALNMFLLVFFLGLISAPFGAFKYLKVSAPATLKGATLSAVSERKYEGFVSVTQPAPAPLMRDVAFTAYAGKKVTYEGLLELKNESADVVNYQILIVKNDSYNEVFASVYFNASETQTEIALPPNGKASISLSAEGFFPTPDSLESNLTFLVLEK